MYNNNTLTIKESLSKASVSFGEMERRAQEIKEKRRDFEVHDVANNFFMEDTGRLTLQHLTFGAHHKETFPVSEWAMSQLSTKIGMPSGYAWKCMQSDLNPLAAQNVNTWIKKQKGSIRKDTTDYFVRTYNNSIDAILSNSYTMFDSPDILETVRDSIPVDDYRIVGSYISNERLHIRMVRDEMLDVLGEDLYPAIFIDSSDVGRTAFHVNFGIWKKVCTNGLHISKIGGVLYHQRHVGIDRLAVEREISASLKSIPDLIEKSKDIIIQANNEKIDLNSEDVFTDLVKKIKKSALVTEDDGQS